MGRASVTAVGFALSDGSAADTAGVASVAPVPDRFGRVLLACVEPIELSSRGMELAAVALRAIREPFAATAGTPAEALAAAFAAANAAVMAQNRPLATGSWERRICVGATAVALAGREIVVAQASPSQAILVQDGQVYAFPDVASWRGDYAPETAVAESHPLGFSDEQIPRLYHSEAAPGDLVILCATNLGRALARDERAIVASVSRLPGRPRLRLRLPVTPGLARGGKRAAASLAAGSDAGLTALAQTDRIVPAVASVEKS